VQDAWVEPEHGWRLYLEQFAVRAVQQVAATLLDPDEGVAAEGTLRGPPANVVLLARAEAEESKFALRIAGG
jgi:hypothetical protein